MKLGRQAHFLNLIHFFNTVCSRLVTTCVKNRLQMQTKYTSLTHIVMKINEASIERKKYDKEIGRLLGELAEAKKKLCETHLHISACVKELIKKKEEIDKQR